MVEQKSKTEFKHGDVVTYINRKKDKITGKITAMRKNTGACKVVDFQGKEFGPISPKSLKLVWRFDKIFFIGGGEVVA